jgi:hypothetical protein
MRALEVELARAIFELAYKPESWIVVLGIETSIAVAAQNVRVKQGMLGRRSCRE